MNLNTTISSKGLGSRQGPIKLNLIESTLSLYMNFYFNFETLVKILACTWHFQSEPAPTKCTIMDEWCVETTLFFIGFFIPSHISEGFCSKSELGVLQWGVFIQHGWWVHGCCWVTQAKLNPMCVWVTFHILCMHSMDEHVGWKCMHLDEKF